MGQPGEFVRFVVPDQLHGESKVTIGVVAQAYELVRDERTLEPLRLAIKKEIDWLEIHLDFPDRFNRTKSKGWCRRETRGISWLRSSGSITWRCCSGSRRRSRSAVTP